MIDYNISDEVLDKNTEIIDNEKLDLIDMDNKLPDDISFQNTVILITCVIKSRHKVYPQILLEEALYDKQTWQ